MQYFGSVVGVILLLGGAFCSCPHQDPGLALFSDLFSNFNENSAIVITESVLLDLAEVEVSTIEINGANGKLVFGRGIDISLTANGIFVKGDGQLIIGSEYCRHTDKVNIYLKGDRTQDRSKVGPDGDKYIAIQENGVLSIHGQDKLAWTKLASTAERFNVDSSKIQYQHQTSSFKDYRNWDEGFALYIFCHALEEKYYEVYDLWKNNANQETDVANKMISKLNEVKDNETVVINIHNTFKTSDGVDLEPLFSLIEDLAGIARGELLVRQAEKDDAFSLVFNKGGDYDQMLDTRKGKTVSSAFASILHNGKVISGTSKVTVGQYHRSSVDTRVLDQSVGFPTITVLDDVSSWKKDELEYRHYGAIEDGVDMRAEVGLLTRNIKVQGIVGRECPKRNGNCNKVKFDAYGGHIKIIGGFGSVHIEGIEMQHVGQSTDKGFYPIHFHMCLDVTGKKALIKRNSIHHTFQRAVVVHGTYGTSEDALGVEIVENVAYHVMGHAFFQEDGAEAATRIEGNLAAEIRNVDNGFFKSDRHQSTGFWITNPKTIMKGNAAAGSEGFGIWYTFPEIPVGISKGLVYQKEEASRTPLWTFDNNVTYLDNKNFKGFGIWYTFPETPVGISKGLVYQKEEASRTPLWTFDNNVVHSNYRGGMNFDNILQEDGGTIGCMRYSPVVNPLDKNSDRVLVQISRLTAYKNPSINTWIRGGGFQIIQYSSADSKRGLQLASGGNQEQFVRKSTFIGRSVGNSEENGYPDGTTGADMNHYLGIVFYDGPIWVQDSYFNGFTSDSNNTWAAGALGFQPKNKFSSSVVSQVKNLHFGYTDGGVSNRVFDGNIEDEILGFGNFDGDESATFRDADGSVTTCEGHAPPATSVQVVKPEKVLLTEHCKYRENWKMAACNDHYGKIHAQIFNYATFRDTDGSVTTCDGHAPPATSVQVVKPEKVLLTENCKYRENWQMAACNDHYGKFSMRLIETFKNEDLDDAGVIRRRRFDDAMDMAYEDSSALHTHEYMAILGGETYYYEFQYTNGNVKKQGVTGNGIERNYPVIVGLCLPSGLTKDDLDFYARHPNDHSFRTSAFTFVNSLDELKTDTTMTRVFLDGRLDQPEILSFGKVLNWHKKFQGNYHSFRTSAFTFVNSLDELKTDTTMTRVFLDGRMIYIKMLSKRARNPDWDAFDTDHCPGSWCPYFEVTVKKNNVPAFTPCFTTTQAELSTDIHLADIPTESCTLSSKAREADWGAGDTRAPHDGQWGDWAGWTDCCNTPTTEMTRTRERKCNNPTPINGGADCVGLATQTETCPNDCPERKCNNPTPINGGADCVGLATQTETCPNDCPVPGVLTQWSKWNDCYCDGVAEGTAGVKTRTRECTAANGGKFCWGALQENAPCNGECGLL